MVLVKYYECALWKDGVRDELHSNMLTLLRSLICALSSC